MKQTPGKHAVSSASWVLTQGWLGLTMLGELHAVSHLGNKGQLALRRLSVLKHQLLVLLFSEWAESTLIPPSGSEGPPGHTKSMHLKGLALELKE